jgi:hypothetical protein
VWPFRMLDLSMIAFPHNPIRFKFLINCIESIKATACMHEVVYLVAIPLTLHFLQNFVLFFTTFIAAQVHTQPIITSTSITRNSPIKAPRIMTGV